MGNSLINILINTDYRNKGAVAAQGALKSLAGGVSNAASQLGLFNLSSLASAGVVVGLATGVKKAVGNYLEYTDAVRQNVNLTGTSAEQTSMLMQLTDDYGISSEKLKTILEGANKKGFQPSIENIAQLSEEYLALNDPVARNQLLIDKLGKSGMELAEVMKQGKQAILDKAAATADGLIVDEEALQQSWDLKMAIDDLEDTATALANSLAAEVLPKLSDFLKFMMKGIEIGDQLANKNKTLKEVWDEHNQVMQSTNVTYEEYITEMERAARAAGFNWEAIMAENGGITELGTSTGYLIENWGALSELQWANRDASQAWMDELDRGGPILETLTTSFEDWLAPIDIAKVSMSELTAELLYNQAAVGLDADAALGLALSMGMVDMDTYSTMSTLNKLRDDLESGKITMEEYEDKVTALGVAMSLIPETVHTKFILEIEGEVPKFNAANRDEPVGLDRNVIYGGERAGGGPVSPDEWYWVGEHGPEPFVPKQAGTIVPNEALGGVVINWNGHVRSDTDIELIARKLAELMQRRK